MKELIVEATLENLDAVIAFVDEVMEENEASMKVMMQVDVAVEELFVNIAHYAYKPNTGMATIQADVDKDTNALWVTFIDQGVPYDPLAKADPDVTLSAEDREIGGLGIFMVKKTMDDMMYEYCDGSNVLKIKKILG